MIKIICENELVYHKIYEFMTMSFPSCNGENSLYLRIFIDRGRAIFKYKDIDIDFDLNIEKDDLINSIKISIYKNIYPYIESSDWGILTGMRPTRLARKILSKNNYSYDKCRDILKDYYLLSEKKLDLLMEVVEIENKILDSFIKDSYSIYIHIPFCKSICSYCSLRTMIAREDRIEAYLEKLFSDIETEAKYLNKRPNSIYIGGGTPTAIGNENLEKLLKLVSKSFKSPIEYTVEAGRTDTIDEETLKILKNYGVNRISLNPQTASIKSSDLINRPIDLKDIEYKFNLAKSIGIENINMDLIMGLPNESKEDIKNSIDIFSQMRPENITIHNLSLKKGSKLLESSYSFENDLDGLVDYSLSSLRSKNYRPYYLYRQKRILNNAENIGYCLEGYESIYNISIIEEVEDIISFGMGSSSKFILKDGKIKQIINFKNLRDYLHRGDEVLNKKIDYYKFKEE